MVFIYFDVKQLCKMHGLNIINRNAKDTVYIYHFTYLQPYTPTITCTHFGELKLLPPKIHHISPLYTGGPITDVNDSMSIVNEIKLYSAIDRSQYVDKYKIPQKIPFRTESIWGRSSRKYNIHFQTELNDNRYPG